MENFINLLKKYNLTVSTAESCTGGLVASAITEITGSSAFFGMGVVTYANEAKMKLLGVKSDTLTAYGAVSEQTAKEMAEGILSLSDSDVSISVTGIAGPTGGTPEKPVGLVYIGISGKFGTFAYENHFSGSRSDVRSQTVEKAFKLAEEYISKFYS